MPSRFQGWIACSVTTKRSIRRARSNCPGCHRSFRRDYLAEHLKSPSRESCRLIADALRLDATGLHLDVRPIANESWTPDVAELFPLRSDSLAVEQERADYEPSPLEEHFGVFGEYAKHLATMIQHYRGVRARPILRAKDEPCALCGLPLGSNTRKLVEHIKLHSAELATLRYRCYSCQVDFLSEADLELHLAAAEKGHCGFNFDHRSEPDQSPNQRKTCNNGHHPPSNQPVYDDHQRARNSGYMGKPPDQSTSRGHRTLASETFVV